MTNSYDVLQTQLEMLLSAETNAIANMANVSALLMESLPDLNWVGFYLGQGNELVLGPFQGKPACTRIPVGEGVCGTAFAVRNVIRIDDVHQFAGHIACDCASNSEIVLPLYDCNGDVVGVLDLDSPVYGRFAMDDQAGLTRLARTMERFIWRICS